MGESEISETAERPNKRIKISEPELEVRVPLPRTGEAEAEAEADQQAEGKSTVPPEALSQTKIQTTDDDDDDDDDEIRRREVEVGIIHYVNPTPLKITGLFKSRYTDFLVNEIDRDGNTLHLTSLEVPRGVKEEEEEEEEEDDDDGNENENEENEPEVTKKNGDGDSGSAERVADSAPPPPDAAAVATTAGADKPVPIVNAQPSDEDVAKLNSHFDPAVVKEILALYESILSKPKARPKDHPVVQTPFTTDRTVRAQIHADVRRIFNSRIDSQTDHSGTLVLSASTVAAANRYTGGGGGSGGGSSSGNKKKKKNGKLNWAERGGEHLHFNLYKENKDSMEMINLLARRLKTNSKAFRIAGTKDRRAATVQRVSAYRIDASRLAGLNSFLRAAALGDFEYKTTGLDLGDLSGNEFVIALREFGITAPPKPSSSLTISSEQQHEGQVQSQSQSPRDLDLDLDQEKIQRHLAERVASLREKGWINYFGLQRFGSFAIRSDVTGLKILQGDFQGACDSILDFNPLILEKKDDEEERDAPAEDNNTVGTDDLARAAAIAAWRKTHRLNDALDKMPKRFAGESAVIRHLSRSPTDHLGALLAIPRTQRTLYVHAYQSRVWNLAASNRWSLYGARVVAGDLVLVHEHQHEHGNQPSHHTNTNANANANNNNPTTDADGEPIVPVSAHDSWRRADDVFDRARPLTAAEAADTSRFSIFDIVLPTPGWDVEYPANASGDFYAAFMATDEGGRLDPRDMRRKHRDFSLSGSYRKFLARVGGGGGGAATTTAAAAAASSDDAQIRWYTRDDEALLHTDFERLHSKDQVAESDAAMVDNDVDQKKQAAILRFQLGVSQYATMALRELSQGGVREYKPRFSGGR